PLRIVVYSKSLFLALTKKKDELRNCGLIGVRNARILQALFHLLDLRQAQTAFRQLSDLNPTSSPWVQLLHKAEALAKDGVSKENADQIDLSKAPQPPICGARLSTLTQSLATKGVRTSQALKPRKTTEKIIDLVQQAILSQSGNLPEKGSIWCAIKTKNYTRRERNFFYLAMHGAQRIGKYWTNIPGYEDRAICNHCNEIEDMEHILFKCTRPNQCNIWEEAARQWPDSYGRFPVDSLGLILGCGLLKIKVKQEQTESAKRLLQILVSTTAHHIWKLRNESVINRDGDSISRPESIRKWYHSLNDRLTMDRILTNRKKFGNRAISCGLVENTWLPLIEPKPPDGWVTDPEVLVGIR
ncbi:hypothetical protein K435DRAFT_569518, partial [Dendrothele bispora CBS 962.96]